LRFAALLDPIFFRGGETWAPRGVIVIRDVVKKMSKGYKYFLIFNFNFVSQIRDKKFDMRSTPST
jgi:hypothetical protein